MNRLDLGELREKSRAWALAAGATPGISSFCSAPLWQLSAHDHLHGRDRSRRHLLRERDGAWAVFAEAQESPGVFMPFEAAWMFGCPLLGEPEAAFALLVDVACEERDSRRPVAFFLGGLSLGGEMHRSVTGKGGRVLRAFPGTDGMFIDLSDGVEAWLARRSRKFRRTLRDAQAGIAGLEIEDASSAPPGELFERLLAIQRRSYKWREGTDIFQMPEFVAFYRSLLEGLHASASLRVLIASRDGLDLAHNFGGVFAGTYRGLQMSYVEEARELALGNRLQWENLCRCAAEGIKNYDLGMHSPYKERWADRREERVGVLWAG